MGTGNLTTKSLGLYHRRWVEEWCVMCGSPFITPVIQHIEGLGDTRTGFCCCECGYDSTNPPQSLVIRMYYEQTYPEHVDRVFPFASISEATGRV
jgi:hypothetical protein